MFYDHNPHRDQLHVTYSLIGISFLLFLWCVIDPHYFTVFLESDEFYRQYSEYHHHRYRRSILRTLAAMTPEGRAIITGFFSFIIYTVGLWIFGDNIEYAMGRCRYILFIVTMFVLTLCVPMMVHHSINNPHIAMSGVVSAIMGAYARIFPNEIIYVHLSRYREEPYEWWAKYVVLFFFFFAMTATWVLPYAPNTIVYLEQVIGLIMGWFCAPLFRNRDVLLIERTDDMSLTPEQAKKSGVELPLTPKQRHWGYLRRGAKDPTDGIRPYGQTPMTMDRIDPNDESLKS